MSNVKCQMSNRKSFTLIEILIVISIIGIMVGVSWSALKFLQPSWQLNSAVRELVGDFRFAQQMAVTEQIDYGVSFSTTTREYQITKYGTTTQVILSKSLPTDIEFKEITGFTNNEVLFNPYGAVKEGGNVSLINKVGKTKTVEIRPSGFVKIAE